MKSNRTIDYILISCFIVITVLYILKVEWSGFLLYLFSLAVGTWFLIVEFRKKQSWTIYRIIPIVFLLLILGLTLQSLLTGANNLIAICITFTMHSFLAERFKTIPSEKKL